MSGLGHQVAQLMALVLVVLERFCDDRLTDGGAIRRHHHVRAAQRVGPVEILVTQPLPTPMWTGCDRATAWRSMSWLHRLRRRDRTTPKQGLGSSGGPESTPGVPR